MRKRIPPSLVGSTKAKTVKTCVVCGEAFETVAALARRYAACSPVCSRQRRIALGRGWCTVTCHSCGIEFSLPVWKVESGLGKYCSEACRIKGLEKAPRHRGSRTGAVSRGYRRIKVWEGDAVRVVMEHRYVMEQVLGRRLRPEERVHHLNHDKLDNRPGNLALYGSQAEHLAREHQDTEAKRQRVMRRQRGRNGRLLAIDTAARAR